MIDRSIFFSQVREKLFGGVLRPTQVDGINAVLDEWQRRQLTDLRHLAYMLATDYHETDKTMQPINEYGGNSYFHRMYDIEGQRPGVARMLGNLYPGDGVLFHGRGLVQLTGRKNYEHMTELVARPLFGVDLEKEPDKALELPIAVAILFEGMLNADSHFGDFTGKSLDQFFNDSTDDPVHAREIINGLDRAETIAEYHGEFLEALQASASCTKAA
jgi:hypothetical protein